MINLERQKMKNILLITLVGILILMAGCTVVEEPVNLSASPVEAQPKKQGNQEQNSAQDKESLQASIEAALAWSKKYENLLTETENLKKTNQKILDDNSKLNETIAVKDTEIAQLKKELNQANEVLVNMRLELNQWKKDILGFREEMRQSQQALLAATAKILRELGAEVSQPALDTANSKTEN